ncbi:PilZ domain-containing protein [Psychromonas sp. MME2]|uniref:PilZ domain-containing protein n=1 Tax=unclassified Psychromonas TaxID=2614957 RepID=UPI00339D2441
MLITHDERRVFQRMEVKANVKIIKGEMEISGLCNDLSSTGMSLQVMEPVLRAGDNIKVILDTQNSRFVPLDVEANVLRVKEEAGRFIAAIEFTNFN